jgi:ATP-binding protein involved in chromosome partitioning
MDNKHILETLKAVIDPDLGRDIVSLGFVKNLQVEGKVVSFDLELTTPACPARDKMVEEARRALMTLPEVDEVNIHVTAQVRSTQKERRPLAPGVKNIVPVASGKGGVGKSTVSVNLAVALAQSGAQVGLLDADVYGPSIPTIMGVKEPPHQGAGHTIIPPVTQGVKIMSMDFFTPPGKAIIWRGPMLHKAVEQFLGQVEWGELDYLIVDLPPGTGDIQLSLCQIIPLTGAVIVSTPQDVALRVAEKAILMFDQLHTPVLGLVENMSGVICSHCGHREEIFGSGGVRRYAMENGLPFLGEIPLATEIRSYSDEGLPVVVAAPESPGAQAFIRVAENLAAQISIQAIGTTKSEAPEPVAIEQPAPTQIRIQWQDGHESLYDTYRLRVACMCAFCVSETTGERLLDPKAVSRDVHPVAINPVGRYALNFEWSDGHSSGIYTYERLRELCQCPECAPEEKPDLVQLG